MTLEVILVALVAGLAGGAAGGVIIGAVQAWMARGRGGGRVYSFARDPRPQPVTVRPASAKPSPGLGPFDRFSGHGKRVLALAQDEAIRQNHNYIGTEHLLAALLRDGDTIPARALTSLGADLTKVRTALEFIIGRGDRTTSPAEITLSPRTKKVVEFAGAEAIHLGRREVEPEHILLGLIDEGQGIASGILESLGLSLEAVRAKVLELLSAAGTPPPAGYMPPPRGGYQSRAVERFSNRAKHALALAQDEAVRMGHSYIGTEHLLLGLARLTGPDQADQALVRIFVELGLTLERVRAEIGKVIPPREQESSPLEMVLSPETKQVFELVVQKSQPDKPILPEYLLLAVVHDEQSFAAQILARLGATPERVRAAIGR